VGEGADDAGADEAIAAAVTDITRTATKAAIEAADAADAAEAGDAAEADAMTARCRFVTFAISTCATTPRPRRRSGDTKSIRRKIKKRFTKGTFEITGTTKANAREMIRAFSWKR
jgi:hypothetical protein